jgi:hypothetical protein
MKSDNSTLHTSKEQQREEAKMSQIKADMKAYLKTQNKNALIRHIFEQLDMYYDLRDLSRHLNEENEQLKKQLETTKTQKEST